MAWHGANSKYFEDVKLAVQQAIERARVNIDWTDNNRALVVDKMREFSAPDPTPSVKPWTGHPNFIYSIFAIHNISSVRLRPFKYSVGK
ncbi:hypothetical protein O3G_MSEX009957 [Manduca sexta]|uniref:Uncharacterized protein n=3 Tax=Manduca sexta TaxID=7130 RepID=A0A921ZG24_MANSE|nr:hypothetical protein O3G_MSEX009957 [Manduca sexta]KAG6456821.1 hypothetical protein O3G_MSEX009957 [Manduca sexta]